MWIARQAYENMLMRLAKIDWLEEALDDLKLQLAVERKRAENAIDAMLIRHDALPISPPPPPVPEVPMFDDDPAVLAEMMKEFQVAPVETLLARFLR
jgi:hypothetical protein